MRGDFSDGGEDGDGEDGEGSENGNFAQEEEDTCGAVCQDNDIGYVVAVARVQPSDTDGANVVRERHAIAHLGAEVDGGSAVKYMLAIIPAQRVRRWRHGGIVSQV